MRKCCQKLIVQSFLLAHTIHEFVANIEFNVDTISSQLVELTFTLCREQREAKAKRIRLWSYQQSICLIALPKKKKKKLSTKTDAPTLLPVVSFLVEETVNQNGPRVSLK